VSGRAPVPPRADVALMEGYHSPQLDVDVRLNTNEAPEPPPEGFVAAVRDAIGEVGLNRYPDRAATELRAAIARLHGVSVDQVYCANGSNEVLQSLLLAYGGPGRSIAVFEPTYALHSHIARVTGTEVLEGERGEDYFVDEAELDRVFALGQKTAAVNPVITFLCSPNNPTGRLEPDAQIRLVLDRAPGLVVVDEAYGQFAPRSALELLDDNPHLVVVRTFSKTWSLAGLRLGYALCAPEIVEQLFEVTLPYHLDSLKQIAGVIALQFESEMHARVARLTEERGRLVAELTALDLDVTPSDANFILFRVNRGDAKAVWRYLAEQSVLVRDVSSWPRLGGYLRVTIGTKAENDAFLTALTAALKAQGGTR
jgi:histidinol-phosphate aminotransferase